MTKKRLTLSLIGAGRVGCTLVSALHSNGYSVASVVNRSGPAAVSLARSVACSRVSTQIADIDRASNLYLIAVQDGELEAVGRAIATIPRLSLRGRVVLHTSGVHDARILASLRKKGASIASFHPLQTFPRGATAPRLRAKLRGIYYGIDGDDDAVKAAERIARELGGQALHVEPGMRPLYHAACVFASGYLSVMLSAVAGLSQTARIGPPWTEVFGPLMATAMENTVRAPGAEALTGPVVRGDLDTIDRHLRALEKSAPQYVPLYTVSALEVARLALERGKISRAEFDALLGLFRSSIPKKRGPVKKK